VRFKVEQENMLKMALSIQSGKNLSTLVLFVLKGWLEVVENNRHRCLKQKAIDF